MNRELELLREWMIVAGVPEKFHRGLENRFRRAYEKATLEVTSMRHPCRVEQGHGPEPMPQAEIPLFHKFTTYGHVCARCGETKPEGWEG